MAITEICFKLLWRLLCEGCQSRDKSRETLIDRDGLSPFCPISHFIKRLQLSEGIQASS
ncbi:hypothetical protein HBI56_225770 [Parastagonospora nodorum]|uniref:Uncharacterized protein n=1 Tax=Phaeosphaeria nodorum (strain SN15 / ATCC MYA-4574 / FGSC 10173) TaxID=321614 RepID=A0A7U2NR83_PHANO|nr:hypothetical protein HBH56_239390 [Parastagonospora nodorum]QRD07605.1 hypothetical protein JI435_162850 [Parastagonospora nodorum SN15]KAH3921598.1 hypothetical protein HBH54_236650 [Parastagonospora nodorum]KAH3939775.1 hypothetical protein HBH53_228570 [Parastagonospora nodorum]KAH3957875.1 hypothetical protein HBH51_217120 [Parastagonospora nodorum]